MTVTIAMAPMTTPATTPPMTPLEREFVAPFAAYPQQYSKNLQTAFVVVPDIVVEIDEACIWDKLPVTISVL